ncbi:MAG: flavodoxin family protein [Arenibacterium sp.]
MSKPKQPAIYCYSKLGHTRRAAKRLAEQTGAEFIPVVVARYSFPGLWVVRALFDVARKNTPPISNNFSDISGRPWLVVAGPVWAGQLAPPVCSVLARLAGTLSPVGLLTTSGDASPPDKAYASARGILGHDFVACVNIENAIENTPVADQRLTEFADLLQRREDKGVA